MDEAFDILGCPYQEKMDIYRVSALCMQLGRMEFQGMGEVASPKNLDAAPAINGISYQPINQSVNQSINQVYVSTATTKSSSMTASSIPNTR